MHTQGSWRSGMLEVTFILEDSECHTGLNGNKKKAVSGKPIINGFSTRSSECLLSSSPIALEQNPAFFRYTEILTLKLKQEPGKKKIQDLQGLLFTLQSESCNHQIPVLVFWMSCPRRDILVSRAFHRAFHRLIRQIDCRMKSHIKQAMAVQNALMLPSLLRI